MKINNAQISNLLSIKNLRKVAFVLFLILLIVSMKHLNQAKPQESSSYFYGGFAAIGAIGMMLLGKKIFF
jgi:hypothetical protein